MVEKTINHWSIWLEYNKIHTDWNANSMSVEYELPLTNKSWWSGGLNKVLLW